jgi:MSHA pilin protein MshC
LLDFVGSYVMKVFADLPHALPARPRLPALAAYLTRRPRQAGFTLVELVTVMVLIGILSAVGASRFFDNNVFEGREYADQAKAIIRYGQKLAIAQNRLVYVRSDGNSFGLCFDPACTSRVPSPAGNNSGSTAAKAYCRAGSYQPTWMCEGRPASVAVTVPVARPGELGPGGFFFFDRMGRPYGQVDAGQVVSTFAPLVLSFTASGSVYKLTIEMETGYVH